VNRALPAGAWLNVGCGDTAPEGWVNIDGSWQAWFASHPVMARAARALTGRAVGHWPRGIVCRDVRSGLGFDDESVSVIYSSHLIEHLSRAEARALLGDAYRSLQPNGVCRVVTPDLASFVSQYLQLRATGDRQAADSFVDSTLLAEPRDSNNGHHVALRWYRSRTAFDSHKWLYDADSLCALFEDVGFQAPRRCAYLDSAIPGERLRQVEHASRLKHGAGIVVEAIR
jgi:methyltransferase family protein